VLQTDTPKQQFGIKNLVWVLLLLLLLLLLLSGSMQMCVILARGKYQCVFGWICWKLMEQLENFDVHCENVISEESL